MIVLFIFKVTLLVIHTDIGIWDSGINYLCLHLRSLFLAAFETLTRAAPPPPFAAPKCRFVKVKCGIVCETSQDVHDDLQQD